MPTADLLKTNRGNQNHQLDQVSKRCSPRSTPREADLARLVAFRTDFYRCLTRRGDALFELTDAVLSTGKVDTLVSLSLAEQHRRGHGALYDAVNAGQVDTDALGSALAALALPRLGGRIVLAVDVCSWLRPQAGTSPDRCFCHVYGRGRARSSDQRVPGWPYQFIVALSSGASSWAAPLDVTRLRPGDDLCEVTAAQVRAVLGRLREAGHHHRGDPDVLLVADAGYDSARLAYLLRGEPVLIVARVRSDRVFMAAAPPRPAGAVGRPRRHGAAMKLSDPATWTSPATTATCPSQSYGRVRTRSWERMHPRLAHRGAWGAHRGDLPTIDGTVIRLEVDHLPGHGAVVVGGFCELGDDDLLYNSAAVVDASGVRAVYRKAHLWDREKLVFTPDSAAPPVVDTAHGRIAVMVCYDLEFPEWTRTAALADADLIAVPTNWPLVPRPDGERVPEVVIAMAAARVNHVAIACADRSGTERGVDWNEGTSVVSSDGWVVSEVGTGTGVAWADLDLAVSRDKRLTEHAHLMEDRRPDLYSAVSPAS